MASSWENSQFLLKLQGNERQYNILIFDVKNGDDIFFKLI